MFVGVFVAYFGEGSGPVLGYINCRGTESNLAQCSRGSVGQRDCHHGKDVGVICQGRVVLFLTVASGTEQHKEVLVTRLLII